MRVCVRACGGYECVGQGLTPRALWFINLLCEGLDRQTLVPLVCTRCSHENKALICGMGILFSVLLMYRASLTLVPVLD